MNLSEAFAKVNLISEFNEILANKTSIEAGNLNGKVAIEGYEGAVEADVISHRILEVFNSETEDSKQLAALLAEKVFIPLTNLNVPPEKQCSLSALIATKKASHLSSKASEKITPLLKYTMVLGLLDRKFAFWG